MNITNFKLAIAMPTNFTHIATPVFSAFLLTKKPNYLWLNEQNGFIDDMRNNSVIKALSEQCSHLFMFDSDMVLHPDVIMKLLENNLDICGALCFKRYPPFYPVLFKQISGDINKKNLSSIRYDHITKWKDNEIIEVDAIGAGVMMIKMNVFKNLEQPYFDRIYKTRQNNQDIFFGEDISFCIKAKRAGYKIYSDTSVKCGHLCLHNINEDDYKLALCLENNLKNKQKKE
jgi:GT2 family glycosyltransferase